MNSLIGSLSMISRLAVSFGVLSALASVVIAASPPFPNEIIEVQPSGQKIILRLNGSRRSSWYTDQHGLTVVKRSDGSWVYAIRNENGQLAPTDLQSGVVNPRFTGLIKGISPFADGADSVRLTTPLGKCELKVVDVKKQLFEVNGYTVTPSNKGLEYAIPDKDGRLVPSGNRVGIVDPKKIGIRPGIRGFATKKRSVAESDSQKSSKDSKEKWWDSAPKVRSGASEAVKPGEAKALDSILDVDKKKVFSRRSRPEGQQKRLPAQRFKKLREGE